jgi:nucleoside 2-deoxyribosyltransferase
MKIYIAHQISGLAFDQANDYFLQTAEILADYGYDVLSPMTGKGYLRPDAKTDEEVLQSVGYLFPSATDHAIFERDRWMVTQADIVYVNLEDMERVSIGCLMELAWASLLGKHTVIVVNTAIYKHCFVKEAADIMFTSHDEAIEYLQILAGRNEL